MNVYVAIIEDRHIDVEVRLFSTKQKAIKWARVNARRNARHSDDLDETLTDGMKDAGWLYYATYSCEGDSIRVEECKIDKEAV